MKYPEIRTVLKNSRVGIAGAGGLGSNCAIALARSGVGTLVIADFDRVEEANLNRQAYFLEQIGMLKTTALRENICRIDPEIKVIAYEKELTRDNIVSVFQGCDVIVEAFDLAEMKEMIIQTVEQELAGIPLIVGSGIAGWGSSDTIRCREIDNCLFVCGDESTEVDDENPPLAPRVGIVANIQANIVLEILLGNKDRKQA